jgi:hypothetical protein
MCDYHGCAHDATARLGIASGALAPQPDTPAYRHGQALHLVQEVSGVLTAWYRGSDGRWYGLVSFAVPYLGLVPSVGLELTNQLVPADALRPRTYPGHRTR